MKRTRAGHWDWIDKPKTEGGMVSKPGASTVWRATLKGHKAIGHEPSPHVTWKESTMKAKRKGNAASAGADYAYNQIQSEYFMDWVRDQLHEASKMDPEQVLPLETKADALVVAGKMLQQLEWDTKRDLRGDYPKEWYEGFHDACMKSREWLADELLEIKGGGGVGEARRKPEHVPGAGHGLEWHRYKEGFVGTIDGERRFLLDPTADGDWILRHVNTKTGFQDRKLGRFGTAADAKDAARIGTMQEPRKVRDYIAVDSRGRKIAGPFKSYGDAKQAAGHGGHTQFVPSAREVPRGAARGPRGR